jgi:hypothetical protein
MDNSVVASVEFYFKGECYTPSLEIDLDKVMRQQGTINRLHHSIAVANGIDAYSYEYEVMMAEEVRFSAPRGLAVEFFHNGEFDIAGYSAKWQELQVLEKVRPIAERCVGVSELDGKPKLKAALIEAYLAGRADARPVD